MGIHLNYKTYNSVNTLSIDISFKSCKSLEIKNIYCYIALL